MKQRDIAALLVEAIGTFVLVLIVLNVSRYGLPFFTAIAAGIAIATFFSAAGQTSGGHFNPAVSLALFSIRKLSLAKTVAYIVVQALGALAGWQVYQYLTNHTLKNTTTSFDWRIMLAEALGTAVFAIAFAAVVVKKVEGWQAAATIGTAFFLGITVAGLASNGLLNPALALGVRSFDVNYFLGPIIGGLVGMNLYVYALDPAYKWTTGKSAAAKIAPASKKTPAKKAKK